MSCVCLCKCNVQYLLWCLVHVYVVLCMYMWWWCPNKNLVHCKYRPECLNSTCARVFFISHYTTWRSRLGRTSLYRWASTTMLPKNMPRSSINSRCHVKHWWCLIEQLSLSLASQSLGMLCPSSAWQSLSRHKPQQACQCSPGLHLRNYPRCHLKWRILSFVSEIFNGLESFRWHYWPTSIPTSHNVI